MTWQKNCFSCSHMARCTVTVGSRRVMAECGHPKGPLLRYDDGGIVVDEIVDRLLYATTDDCVRYEPAPEGRVEGLRRGVLFRNSEIDAEYGDRSVTNEPGWVSPPESTP